jgi:hypothetical protein
MVDVDVKRNPPFAQGRVWLFGHKGAAFPFTKGPVYTMKDRPDHVLVPALLISKVLRHLGLEQQEQAMFWNIRQYEAAKE